MKAITVKINRSTIRRNPDAGKTQSHVLRKIDYSFKFLGNKKPKWMKEKDGVYLEEYEHISGVIAGTTFVLKGRLTNKELTEILLRLIEQKDYKKLGGDLTITVDYDYETINHAPSPEYLYEYEKTFIKCSNCKAKIEVNEIVVDYIDDEVRVEICPKCHGYNTFPEYKYEKISDAIKS